jgi:hypothetical protein
MKLFDSIIALSAPDSRRSPTAGEGRFRELTASGGRRLKTGSSGSLRARRIADIGGSFDETSGKWSIVA